MPLLPNFFEKCRQMIYKWGFILYNNAVNKREIKELRSGVSDLKKGAVESNRYQNGN